MKNKEVFEGNLTAKPGEVYQYTEITGSVYASGIKNFAEQFPRLKKVGGDLDLRGLTSLPAGFKPTVGGDLYLSGLTSLPAGFKPTVGGDLYLSGLTSEVKGGDNTAAPRCRAMLASAFAAAGFSFADGILARVVSQRGPVARVVICGKTEVSYLVTDGSAWSHGKTLVEARDGLIYKIGSRDKSEYKAWTLDRAVTRAEAIKAYRVITGACEGGVRAWLEQRKTPEKITVSGIIELTKGAYGADAFKSFFNTPQGAAKPRGEINP